MQKSSIRCTEAGNLFQIHGPATSNNRSPSQVLVRNMTNGSAADD